jgi:hypothetical protein
VEPAPKPFHGRSKASRVKRSLKLQQIRQRLAMSDRHYHESPLTNMRRAWEVFRTSSSAILSPVIQDIPIVAAAEGLRRIKAQK